VEPNVPSIIQDKQDLSITESYFQSEDNDGEEETNPSMISESGDSDGSLRPTSTPVRARRHRSLKRTPDEEGGRDRSNSRSRPSTSEDERQSINNNRKFKLK